MVERLKRFRAPEPETAADDERRNHYRIDTQVSLRVRHAASSTPEGPRVGVDLVESFEELSSAASRYRKDLTGSGRQFLDRLMATMDALVGAQASGSTAGGWTPKSVVDANLSAGGLGVHSERAYALGESVEVEFSVLGEQSAVPFRALGRVRRCEPVVSGGYDFGVEFEEMAATTRERLIRLVFDLQRVQLRSRSPR